jgi:hypothetical protein
LVNEAQLIQQQYKAPILPFIPVEKAPFLKPSRPRGKVIARALTGTEMAEKEANKIQAATKVVSSSAIVVPAQAEEDTIEVIPNTPLRHEASALTPQDDLPQIDLHPQVDPPPSTAPARVEGVRSKRYRANTGYYRALQAGDSQDARDKRIRR